MKPTVCAKMYKPSNKFSQLLGPGLECCGQGKNAH